MGNRRLANWFTGVACVLLAGMSAAQAQSQPQPIRFAVAAEPYPPYTEKQANGEWKGFEVDLIHKLCSEMKAECEIKEVAWDGIIPSLLSKKIDVIFSSMSVTEEREKQIAFSKAYYDSVIALVGPKGTSVKKYPDDLKGKIIGVQNSTVSASYLKQYYEKIADVKYYDTQDSANADLIAGRIDLMMADGTAMAAFVQTPDASNLEYLGAVPYDPIFGKGVGAGLRKDDADLKARLDKAITSLLAGKDYDDLSQHYFGTSVKPAF
ncbi:transporter substrate-binding domain-containing protein [Pseudomonas sp. MDT2-39-1]|uniref:transporter substrate-binding domain-containing protein n=1 Tax=Pseudomonas sp. BGI-2 TaxID=2528211 RepID=UPI001034C607|nr:transporter substrate-binding domain-containing protein [Pseudomonas sp. BGI-2]TBN32140.1 transporter substrate-binding domain-containing protein [Pseudomonas sp. BGI-2]